MHFDRAVCDLWSVTRTYVQRRFHDSCGSHILSWADMLLEILSVQSGCSRFSSDLFSAAEAQAYIDSVVTDDVMP